MISNDVATAAKHAPRHHQFGLPSGKVSLPASVCLSAVRTHRLPSCVRPVHDPDMTTEGRDRWSARTGYFIRELSR